MRDFNLHNSAWGGNRCTLVHQAFFVLIELIGELGLTQIVAVGEVIRENYHSATMIDLTWITPRLLTTHESTQVVE